MCTKHMRIFSHCTCASLCVEPLGNKRKVDWATAKLPFLILLHQSSNAGTMWPGKIIPLLSDDRILALEKQTRLVGGGWSPIEGLEVDTSSDRDIKRVACLGTSMTETHTYTRAVWYWASFINYDNSAAHPACMHIY